MIFIGAPDGLSDIKLPAAKLTAAKLHTASGACVVTMTGDSGQSITKTLTGQDAADFYNALVAIQAATLSSGS
jgi:hypothetical protein